MVIRYAEADDDNSMKITLSDFVLMGTRLKNAIKKYRQIQVKKSKSSKNPYSKQTVMVNLVSVITFKIHSKSFCGNSCMLQFFEEIIFSVNFAETRQEFFDWPPFTKLLEMF